MTEEQWLSSSDPLGMLNFLNRRRHWTWRLLRPGWPQPVSRRKLRLAACAFCSRSVDFGREPPVRAAVAVAERFADGEASDADLLGASAEVVGYLAGSFLAAGARVAGRDTWEAVTFECDIGARYRAGRQTAGAGTEFDAEVHRQILRSEYAAHSHLIRDIFGTFAYRRVPFRTASVTTKVVALAQAVYAENRLPDGQLDNDSLAILADALEETDCADASVVAHLRERGPHVRGCWVLDLLLNKN